MNTGAAPAAVGIVHDLLSQAWLRDPETLRLMRALTPLHEGVPIAAQAPRFVGGCVRDALAGRAVNDVDIATPLKPDEVIARLTAEGIPHVPTGLSHGTVTALVNGRPYEVTTLRLDVMTFGRHADVKFTDDWKTDAARRDFTINALSYDLEGNLYDYFGGVEDLRQGLVRFVGDPARRIAEDVLRILRYFRFLAQFWHAHPDPEAVHACQKAAPEIRKLSGERIRQEVLKLLEAAACAPVWRLMLQGGIVTHIVPEATDWQSLARLVALEDRLCVPVHAMRRLAAVLVVTPEGLKHTVQALRLSAQQATQLFAMTAYVGQVPASPKPAQLRRLVYRHGNSLAMSLLLLAAARSGGDVEQADFDLVVGFCAPRLPVSGQDVMALGLAGGPAVGELLRQVETWWLDHDMQPDRAACLEHLRQRAG